MAFKSNAINSQKTAVYIEDDDFVGVPLVITGITKANPGVVTSTAHGLDEGDVGTFAAIVGMVELNGTTAIVESPATNTFEIHEVNTTGFTTYASAGTFTPKGWLKACEIKNMSFTGGQAAEIDVSTVCSEAKEFLLGLQDAGEASLEVNFVPGDPAIAEFLEAAEDGQPRWFKVVMPDSAGTPGAGGSLVFEASVRQVSFSFGVDQAYQGTFSLRLKGAIEQIDVPVLPEAA